MLRSLIITLFGFGLLFSAQPQVVLKLAWGSEKQQAGLRAAPEAYYGPQAFHINADGSLWLLDSQNKLLKKFNKGRLQEKNPVPETAEDFWVTGPKRYFILDQNRILFLKNNRLRASYTPPARQLIQSLFPAGTQGLALNFCNGKRLLWNAKAGQPFLLRPGYFWQGIAPIFLKRKSPALADIQIGNLARFTVHFPNHNLASLRFLGMDQKKRIYIDFEFFKQQTPLRVRREVFLFDRLGRELAVLHIPVNNHTQIFRDLELDQRGFLYHLVSLPEGIEIIRWNFNLPLNAAQPPQIEYPRRYQKQQHYNLLIHPPLFYQTEAVADFEDYPQVLPDEVISTGDRYEQLLWDCAAENLTNGVIIDEYGNPVETPDWIQIGQNQKVPYKWGGFSAIESFLNGIDIGKYAGDKYTDKSSGTPSAAGVDCSGFVSRCWNLPSHYSTGMMDDGLTLAYNSWDEEEPGDAVHKVGHVRLFVQHNGDGSLMALEASGKDWRVSYRNYYYGDLTDYTPRYYVNRQGAPGNIPQPRIDFLTYDENANLNWSVAGQENIERLRLYSSDDGLTWAGYQTIADDISQHSEPLADGQAIYYRMTSLSSEDGQTESPLSDTYGVYRNDNKSPVLIVDGFDRTTCTDGSWGKIYHDFAAVHGRALYANRVPFETADNDAVLRGEISLNDYIAVFWISGDESTHDGTFNKDEQELVMSYLQNGGRLFVSGSEIGWDLDEKGSAYDRDFYNQYLKADYLADDSQSYTVYGAAGSPFDGLTLHFDDGSHGVYAVGYPDVLTTLSGSSGALNYDTGDMAAVYFEGLFPQGAKAGKLFNMAFPFETIYDESERNALMAKIVDFFDLDVPSALAEEASVPRRFALYGNAPNPFNGQTKIRFAVPGAGSLCFRVFNTLGQEAFRRSIVYARAGNQEILFTSDKVPSGCFFYRLTFKGNGKAQTATGKMLIIK